MNTSNFRAAAYRVGQVIRTKYGPAEVIAYESAKRVKIRFKRSGHERYTTAQNLTCDHVRDPSVSRVGKSKPAYVIGDIVETGYGPAEVIAYEDNYNVTIKFRQTGTVINAAVCNIKRKLVKDRQAPTVYGVGIIGSGTGADPAYSHWQNMLKRCYSEAPKLKTYKDVTVCPEFQEFEQFKTWFDQEMWKYGVHQVSPSVDKDLSFITGASCNKVYSSTTCFLLPMGLNVVLARYEQTRASLDAYAALTDRSETILPRGINKIKDGYSVSILGQKKGTVNDLFNAIQILVLNLDQTLVNIVNSYAAQVNPIVLQRTNNWIAKSRS